MSGIKITKAIYGTGTKTVDVTAGVSTHIRDGTLSLVVSADALNIPDPVPGQQKILNVEYTINNGKPNAQMVKDNEMLMISAPSEIKAVGLQITKAEYGYAGNFTDVTDAIQTHVRNGSINIKVGPDTAGIPDPNPNKQKSLEVEYTINGSKNMMSLTDGKQFMLSAPPMESSGGSDQSVGTMIGYAILWALIYSLHAISVFASYHYGKLFNQYVGYFFGGISLVPGGFFAVCLFAMFYPLYSGVKLDIIGSARIPFRSTLPIVA